MSDADVKMPPLPEPDGWIGANDIDPDAGSEGYSMPTLQAYARAAVLAERERCAKVCEEFEAEWARLARGNRDGTYDHMQNAAEQCACAIRESNKA